MADSRLAEYLRMGLEAGHSLERMEKALIKEGWSRDDVDDAIDSLIQQKEKQEMMTGHLSHLPEELQLQGNETPETRLPEAHGEQGPIKRIQRKPQGKVPERPIDKPPDPAQPQQRSMGVVSKFKGVLAHPTAFFQSVRDEKGYEAPVKYYLFLVAIEIIVANAVLVAAMFIGSGADSLFTDSISDMLSLGLGVASQFIFINIAVILSIVAVFIVSAIMSRVLRIFGGEGSMADTFKGVVYASTPLTLMVIIILPVSIFMQVSALGMISSGSGADPFSGLMSFGISVILVAVLEIAFSIWTLYLTLKGQSIFHGISKARVFGACIVTSIIIGILFIAVQMVLAIVLLVSLFPF